MRSDQVAYLEKNGVSVPTAAFEKAISMDDNIFGFEMEEAGIAFPENRFDPEEVISVPEASIPVQDVSIRFEKGIPIELKIGSSNEWKKMSSVEILEELNRVGLEYRIGIFDFPEPRPSGILARKIHIAPGMNILVHAHHLLRNHVTAPDWQTKVERMSAAWSEFVMAVNQWSSPVRARADKLFEKLNDEISGEVSLQLRMRAIRNPRVQTKKYLGESSRLPLNSNGIRAVLAQQIICEELFAIGRLKLHPRARNNLEKELDEMLLLVPRLIDSAYTGLNRE